MNRGAVQVLGGSLCLVVFTVGLLPIADALYASGLWPRLTPEELQLKLQRDYRMNVGQCTHGTNGWEYICQLPGKPGVRQFFDRLAVQGSPFGTFRVMVELRPGPVPSSDSYLSRPSTAR